MQLNLYKIVVKNNKIEMFIIYFEKFSCQEVQVFVNSLQNAVITIFQDKCI